MTEDKTNQPEEKKEMRVQFVCKDTFYDDFELMKNKCIRSILWTAEVALGKDDENFKNIRKAVLDNINTLMRDIEIICDRDIFTKINKK